MNSPFKRPLLRLRTILSGFDLPLLAVVLTPLGGSIALMLADRTGWFRY